MSSRVAWRVGGVLVVGILMAASAATAQTDGTSVPDAAAPPDPAAVVAPPAQTPAAAQPAAEPAAPRAPDEQFDLKVRSLEEKVTELKEKILQTKARLQLLQESVITGDLTSGAKAVLVHRNEMGSSFVLESVTYVLDGAPVFTRVDTSGELDRQAEIEIFNGRIVPGQHQVGVRLVYRGSGYGLFSYLNDYKFKVQSSYTFNAEGGKVTKVSIVGYEKGGLTADLQDRPAVRYDVEVTKEGRRRPGELPVPQASAGGAR